jgi:hypothetical protein
MDHIGTAQLLQALEELNVRFPGRFEPAPLVADMARTNARFYPHD